jgi:hypothetical protein
LKIIKKYPQFVINIPERDQTEELYKEALKVDGMLLYYIKNQTQDLCLTAVKQNGHALRYVKKHNKELCLAANFDGVEEPKIDEDEEEYCISCGNDDEDDKDDKDDKDDR